jgi:beta-glucosidase-like glycosyl hydrolase
MRRSPTFRAMNARRTIARRMMTGLPESGLTPGWERDFAAFPPAGVLVFRRDFRDLEDLRRLAVRLRELARPQRLFIAVDEEGGFVSQLRGHLLVPPNAALLARGAGPGDIEWAARVTGQRLRALGVDWDFAPVADVNALPANPVIGPRAYGTDAKAAAHGVAEAVRGFQAARVACCLKHFPGHGSTALDSHLALPVCDADRVTIERRDLEPFRAACGAPAVMTAHVLYPALDAARPATFSRAIVRGLLRGTLGFKGVCITDALEMKGAAGGRTPLDAAMLALEAGCDLLLVARDDGSMPALQTGLAEALESGWLDRVDFETSAERIESFGRACPEPTVEELAQPLATLTPVDWEERLERIATRGLVVRGALPREAVALPWRVEAPDCLEGPGFRGCLASAGLPMRLLLGEPGAGEPPGVEFVAIASRVPLADSEFERLRALCRARPTVLVGLQNDAFLDALPEAAVRISAADATPLTRRAVSRAIADLWRAAGGIPTE